MDYIRTDGDTQIYRCWRHGQMLFPPHGIARPNAKRKQKFTFDQMFASTDFRERLRYAREDETRVYWLQMLPCGDADVWVGSALPSTRLGHFNTPDDAMKALQDADRTMQAEGWRKVV